MTDIAIGDCFEHFTHLDEVWEVVSLPAAGQKYGFVLRTLDGLRSTHYSAEWLGKTWRKVERPVPGEPPSPLAALLAEVDRVLAHHRVHTLETHEALDIALDRLAIARKAVA